MCSSLYLVIIHVEGISLTRLLLWEVEELMRLYEHQAINEVKDRIHMRRTEELTVIENQKHRGAPWERLEIDDSIRGVEYVFSDAYAGELSEISGFTIGRDGLRLACAISVGTPPVIRIHGEMNESTASFVNERIHKAARLFSQNFLVLDLLYCDYMDASDLALLIQANRDLKEEGAQLCLANLSSQIKRIFYITRMDKILTVLS